MSFWHFVIAALNVAPTSVVSEIYRSSQAGQHNWFPPTISAQMLTDEVCCRLGATLADQMTKRSVAIADQSDYRIVI